jgi:hypothetical protein
MFIAVVVHSYGDGNATLDDQSLSAMTGQDGLTVSVNISKIDFKQAAIIDNDGFSNPDATLPGKRL